MDEHSSSLNDLDLDAWVGIGQRLPIRALASLALSCRTLNHHITQNQSLWSSKLQTDYGQTWRQLSGAYDWPAAYKAATSAAYQLRTKGPWKACLSRPPNSSPASTANTLLICPQSVDPSWHAPILAASIDQHLVWWRPSTPNVPWDSNPAAQSPSVRHSRTPSRSAQHTNPGPDVQDTMNPDVAADPYFVGDRSCSDPQHAHSAFVDVLVRIPASSGIGYASGSRDKTIKLWTPFSGSSSSSRSSGTVRPLKTLRGHSGSITALLVVPTAVAGPTHSSSSSSSDTSSSSRSARSACDLASRGGSAATLEIWDVPAVLASASADKTIKIWSLASLQSSSSGSAGLEVASDGSSSKLPSHGAATLQGRNPLLATLRGHSDCVTDLALYPGSSSSSSLSCKLLSSSRDCRIKVWDLGSQSCVQTWKVPGPCNKFVPGLTDLSGSPLVTVLSTHSLYVLDPRIPANFGGNSNPGILTVHWPSGGVLKCAAAHGTMLAAGGRKGVRLWDVRVPPPQATLISNLDSVPCNRHPAKLRTSKFAAADTAGGGGRDVAGAPSSSSSSSSSSRVLLTGHTPNNAPVIAVHLDRQRLVAATKRVQLHSGASIVVWSLPECRRVQHLSSMLAPVSVLDVTITGHDDGAEHFGNLGNGAAELEAAAAAAAPAAAPETIWELIQSLSAAEAAEALELMHDHQQQQQHQEEEEEVTAHGHISQQQQQQHMEHDLAGSGFDADDQEYDLSGTGSDLISGSSSSSSSSSEDDGWPQTEVVQEYCDWPVHWGSIEPGVLSMALCGPVLATVNILGNVLLRDFPRGCTPVKALEPYRSSSNPQSMQSSITAHEHGHAGAAGDHVDAGGIVDDATPVAQVLSKFWRA